MALRLPFLMLLFTATIPLAGCGSPSDMENKPVVGVDTEAAAADSASTDGIPVDGTQVDTINAAPSVATSGGDTVDPAATNGTTMDGTQVDTTDAAQSVATSDDSTADPGTNETAEANPTAPSASPALFQWEPKPVPDPEPMKIEEIDPANLPELGEEKELYGGISGRLPDGCSRSRGHSNVGEYTAVYNLRNSSWKVFITCIPCTHPANLTENELQGLLTRIYLEQRNPPQEFFHGYLPPARHADDTEPKPPKVIRLNGKIGLLCEGAMNLAHPCRLCITTVVQNRQISIDITTPYLPQEEDEQVLLAIFGSLKIE